MKKLKAFILGAIEFRQSFTTSFDDLEMVEAYEQGRELSHKITFRKYEG